MHRFSSALAAIAFVATLGTGAAFAGTTSSHSSSSMMSSTHKTTCAKNETWVKGYTKKDGTKVKGYCRAAKSSSMSSTKKTTK